MTPTQIRDHTKPEKKEEKEKKLASQQTAGNSTGHEEPSTECMRRPDTIVHAQLGVERQRGHFELSVINYVQRY